MRIRDISELVDGVMYYCVSEVTNSESCNMWAGVFTTLGEAETYLEQIRELPVVGSNSGLYPDNGVMHCGMKDAKTILLAKQSHDDDLEFEAAERSGGVLLTDDSESEWPTVNTDDADDIYLDDVGSEDEPDIQLEFSCEDEPGRWNGSLGIWE